MDLKAIETTAEADVQKAAAEVKTKTIANPWVALTITAVVSFVLGLLVHVH